MELSLNDLKAVRVLGRGATGTVFLVSRNSSPQFFALKVVQKVSLSSHVRRARWEIEVLSLLRHPFLPSLLGNHESSDLIFWAVPFCSGGDLNALRHSKSDEVLSYSAIRFYVSEIVLALSHLHSLGIVYRDLKPENVLIQSTGHVTLTDFDLSRKLSPSSESLSSPEKKRKFLSRILAKFKNQKRGEKVTPRFSVGRSCSFVGTEEYVSPEVIRGEGHEFAVDWWGLGILTYELAYGRTPFKGRNRKETFFKVISNEPEFPGKQPLELIDLIKRFLAKDPAKRLGFSGGAEEIKAHPFFHGLQWELLAGIARPPFLGSSFDDGENSRFDVRDYFKNSEGL